MEPTISLCRAINGGTSDAACHHNPGTAILAEQDLYVMGCGCCGEHFRAIWLGAAPHRHSRYNYNGNALAAAVISFYLSLEALSME
ncbi:hypothetical protein ES703_57578 [subsurface metagenome]